MQYNKKTIFKGFRFQFNDDTFHTNMECKLGQLNYDSLNVYTYEKLNNIKFECIHLEIAINE